MTKRHVRLVVDDRDGPRLKKRMLRDAEYATASLIHLWQSIEPFRHAEGQGVRTAVGLSMGPARVAFRYAAGNALADGSGRKNPSQPLRHSGGLVKVRAK